MGEDATVVVFDNGSYSSNIGFAGEDAPRARFLTVVGRPGHADRGDPMHTTGAFVGREALTAHTSAAPQWPIARGLVSDWSAMQALWGVSFQTLHVRPEDQPVLLTEP